VSGSAAPQSNVENLLDIDFDGAAPASLQERPPMGSSGLEGLGGTPQRIESPAAGAPGPSNTMDDLMGIFGSDSSGTPAAGPSGSRVDDMMNGFGGLDVSGTGLPPKQQATQKKNNEDILGLF
jgi:AP-1 complex subunit beta-1